jgi:RHS repeat-associated protein
MLPSGIRNTVLYNGDGKRAEKQDSTGTIREVWDGEKILEETDGNNAIQVTYTLSLADFGNLVSQHRSGTTSFFAFDALGSTRQLIDINGAATDNYLYQAFGIVVPILLANTNPFRFVGQKGYYLDADLGSYWLRGRLYDPVTGLFRSPDPLRLLLVREYTYASNSPANLIDPSGLDAISSLSLSGKPLPLLCGGYDFFLRVLYSDDNKRSYFVLVGYQSLQGTQDVCAGSTAKCNCNKARTLKWKCSFWEPFAVTKDGSDFLHTQTIIVRDHIRQQPAADSCCSSLTESKRTGTYYIYQIPADKRKTFKGPPTGKDYIAADNKLMNCGDRSIQVNVGTYIKGDKPPWIKALGDPIWERSWSVSCLGNCGCPSDSRYTSIDLIDSGVDEQVPPVSLPC